MASFAFSSSSVGIQNLPLKFNEAAILHEIKEVQNEIDRAVGRTRWPLLEEAKRVSSFSKAAFGKIANRYFMLAEHFYAQSCQIEKATKYWTKGLQIYQMCCEYLTDSQRLNYVTWFCICSAYSLRLQVSIQGKAVLEPRVKIDFIMQGLNAVNHALEIERQPAAIERKFILLKLLEESDVSSPESAMDLWIEHLMTNPDPSSNHYLISAQNYGAELARIGHPEKAKQWLLDLSTKKKHPITHLFLGKVLDTLKDYSGAIEHLQIAHALEQDNLEIQLWLVSLEVKHSIKEAEDQKNPPSQDKLNDLVGCFNTFCATFPKCDSHLSSQTSAFMSLKVLADHFYHTLIPQMAHLLGTLQQFKFALALYKNILENFESFKQAKVLVEAEKSSVEASIGVCYLLLNDDDQAGKHLRNAIDLNPANATALNNLSAIYAKKGDVSKLQQLCEQIKSVRRSSLISESFELSPALYNISVGFALLSKSPNDLTKTIESLRLSLEDGSDYLPSKLLLARTLTLSNRPSEAKDLLTTCYKDLTSCDMPFKLANFEKHQIYFCYAGVLALCGEYKEAEKMVIEASKTQVYIDETNNLRAYIRALSDSKDNKESLEKEIKSSIGKVSFPYKIGKICDPQSKIINKGDFIGYHGTADFYAEEIIQSIQPRKVKVRQFKGEGFYIAESREAASYFAKKKVEEEGKGKPVLLKIYASGALVGKRVNSGHKIKHESLSYDFLSSEIDGLEAFSQHYIMENSLKKLKADALIEEVEWSDEDYKKFLNIWKRGY